MAEKIRELNELLALYGPAILFYGIAALVVASAAYAVWARKIDHAAFSLMACFSGVACVYALLGSDFLAVTQVIVYVGGIMILVVFGVLLTDRLPVEFRQITRETVVQGSLVALPVLAALVWAVLGTTWPLRAGEAATLRREVARLEIPAGTAVKDAVPALSSALGCPVVLDGEGGAGRDPFEKRALALDLASKEGKRPVLGRDVLARVGDQASVAWEFRDGALHLRDEEGTTKGIGTLLLTKYLFPFEFASLLLLVALVGAARLARGGRR